MGKLLDFSEPFRRENISRSIYNANDRYQSGHTRAISDDKTPEWGKGRVDDRVGGSIDIQKRQQLKTKNDYTFDNQYGVSEEDK